MEKSKDAKFFSHYRWSPGSMIIIIILSVMNLLLILGGIYFHTTFLFYVSIISIAVEIFIIFIKGFENLVIIENGKIDVQNEAGIAITDIQPGKEGVIKIKNELWSARSDEKIKKGDIVIVFKKEGLYLIVKRK
ncbi:MAG: NfeD family protein [Thermoplasmata archaeon]